MSKPKLLIADDSKAQRFITRRSLDANQFEIVGEATNGADAVAKYDQLRPDRNRIFRHTPPEQCVRAPPLNHPAAHGSVFILHIQVNPRVRVDQLDPGHRARELNRTVRVELGGECVVPRYRNGRCHQDESHPKGQ